VTTEPKASPSSERIGFVSVNKSIQMLEIAAEHTLRHKGPLPLFGAGYCLRS
jgi:hypothetical protein